MTWDYSSEREGEQTESLRNKWLVREEAILQHFKISDSMIRWGYRIMRVMLPLAALLVLVMGLLGRNLYCILTDLILVPYSYRILKRERNKKYDCACAEVEAAINAVRRGESVPPEYTPATQKLREPLLNALIGQFAVLAGFLLFCAAVCIGMAIFFVVFFLIEDGPGGIFWGLAPVYILLIALGVVLGRIGILYARSARMVRKQGG